MRKLFIALLLLLLVTIIAVLISVRFFPKLYVSGFNYFSDDNVTVEQLELEFFPLSVNVAGLGLTNDKQQTALTAKGVDFSLQLFDLVSGKRNFWQAKIDDVDIQLNNLSSSAGESSNTQTQPINVHELLSSLNLQVKNLRVNFNEQRYLLVNQFITKLNAGDGSDYISTELEADFSLDYYDSASLQEPLHLEGLLTSAYKGNASVLGINVALLELSQFLEGKEADLQAVEEPEIIETSESSVDWSWMSLIKPLELKLDVQKVVLENSHISDLQFEAKLDESIDFTYASHIQWLESEAFEFDDQLQLSGQWAPINENTLGADLKGNINLLTSVLTLNIDGDININGIDGNNLNINLQSKKLPITSSLDDQTLSLLEQYFPINTSLSYKQASDLINLQIANAQLGSSDIKGSVSVNSEQTNTLVLKSDLESTLISFQSGDTVDEKTDDVSSDTAAEKTKAQERIFSQDEIDWSWLDGLDVDVKFNAQTLKFNELNAQNLILPLTINNNKLNVQGFEVGLASGAINSDISLEKQQESALIDIDFKAAQLLLEQLNLLPPEELKNALMDINMSVTTNGNSVSELASSLGGKIKLNIGDGIISNNSFELIGSDFILSMLSKLNPFVKKDKTTELECAVVNLDIEQGKINIDKSLAIRTSKMSIVADGDIDLNSEKIKLGLTPKARSGLGVDVSSLVKFIALGGTLSKPQPTITASGVLKSTAIVGAAVSTGGVSLLATSLAEKTVANVDVCKRADNAFNEK